MNSGGEAETTYKGGAGETLPPRLSLQLFMFRLGDLPPEIVPKEERSGSLMVLPVLAARRLILYRRTDERVVLR
jgi:hypothetical protein